MELDLKPGLQAVGQHVFHNWAALNPKDATRRAISVTERQRYILRVRTIAKAVAECYHAQREKLGFPGLKHKAA